MAKSFAYFGNCIDQEIGVNLNASLKNRGLDPRNVEPIKQEETQQKDMMQMQVVLTTAYPTGPNRGKDLFGFGDGQTNEVWIFYKDQSDASIFEISVTGVSGQSLYFYVFGDTLVGKDGNGNSSGITIAVKQVEKRSLQ